MSFPPLTLGQVQMPSWVSLPPVWCGDDLVTRSTNELRAVDPGDGATRWRTAVDPDGGSGHFLCAFGKVALTDRRPDPKHPTQVVGVRGPKVALRLDLPRPLGQGPTPVPPPIPLPA